MPFGRIFAAVFFGLICGGFGLRKLAEAGAGDRWFGGLAALASLSLAVALLTRRPWARWAGVAVAGLLAWFSIVQLPSNASMELLLILFGSVVTLVLLVLPASGRAKEEVGSRRGLDLAACVALTAIAGMAFLYFQGLGQAPGTSASAAGESLALPASETAIPTRIVWTDFGSGVERAKKDGSPILVHFYASWCGYCKKMDRETWANPKVIEQTSGMIAVRVDIDQTEVVRGFAGERLAGRYGIRGTPSQLIVNADGELLARAGGYQDPAAFLSWLDQSVPVNAARREPVHGVPAQRLPGQGLPGPKEPVAGR